MNMIKFISPLIKHMIFRSSYFTRMLCVLVLLINFTACSPFKKDLTLVKNGRANCVIVVPSELNELQKIAIEDFTRTAHCSSGAEIPVISEQQEAELHKRTIRIIVGPSPMTEKFGCKADDLKEEEFRIITIDNTIIILAQDIQRPSSVQDSRVTTWAFSYILDNYVGVRWLWPGELGTVVPKHKTIRIPELNIRKQTELLERRLRSQYNPDITLWTAHHQVAGKRVNYRFAHSFRTSGDNGEWWERLHKTHPDYFAKNPSDKISYTNNNKEFFQLCISNPAVTDEIVRLWEQAGKPDFWDVTPNDGSGFCTCDSCRALDMKYGDVSYTKEEIWNRPEHVFLTDRYVWHWNRLIKIMREKNPNIRIGVYFYSAYRNPPKKLKLEEGIIGEIVHGFDYTFWKAWQDAGAKEIGLRPNWWHMGANGPNLPLHQVGKYIEQARAGGMLLIDMDSMNEYWAAQGPYYYLVARLIARPDMNTEDIITEYCESFGKASADIRRYLDFWEEYHMKVAYNIPAGGALSQNPDGLYETICREKFGRVLHPLDGHWKTMPYIYNSEILAKAYAILNDAEKKSDTKETSLRIDFLRDGLNQVRKVITLLEASGEKKGEALKNLADFSQDMQNKYGYWGSNGISVMRYRGVIGKDLELNGL